jgi:hypothetical protein
VRLLLVRQEECDSDSNLDICFDFDFSSTVHATRLVMDYQSIQLPRLSKPTKPRHVNSLDIA